MSKDILFRQTDISGGMNLNFNIANNECIEAKNVLLDTEGMIRKRDGSVQGNVVSGTTTQIATFGTGESWTLRDSVVQIRNMTAAESWTNAGTYGTLAIDNSYFYEGLNSLRAEAG